jgi:hypothetical protein
VDTNTITNTAPTNLTAVNIPAVTGRALADHDRTIPTWKDAAGDRQEIGIIGWEGTSRVVINSFDFYLPISAPIVAVALITILAAVSALAFFVLRKRPG